MLPVKIVPVKVEAISAKVNFGEQAFVSTTEKELKEMLTVTAVNNDGTAYNGGEAIADFTVQFADGGLVTGRNVISSPSAALRAKSKSKSRACCTARLR